jgi:hypothetical protein
MRGQFNLSLSDGKVIPLRFCTWSLKRFCKLQGIGPAEIGIALSGKDALDAIVNLIRSAAEYEFIKEGKTANFTEVDVCDWVDDIGGIAGTQFQDIMAALSESMTSGLEQPGSTSTEDGEEKKN